MITLEQFYRAYNTFRKGPDPDQGKAIKQSPEQPLFIVAGP
jgi:hypothetical protein